MQSIYPALMSRTFLATLLLAICAYDQLDVGLDKEFVLWPEKARLQFRAEAFNIFNHTNSQAPASNISSSAFGTITSTFPAGQLQFAVKVRF